MNSQATPRIHTCRPRPASTCLIVLALGLAAAFLQIRWCPANSEIHVDGTLFAYGGWRILEGDLPYRDFFDHKPPMVFYLNAAAFRLWGVDAWSVWYLTVAWTVGIAVGFYAFLGRLMPRRWAFLGSIVLLAMVLQRRFYEEPNLTEFYGLLPAVLALYFTHRFLSLGKPSDLAGLGAMLALAGLLKHTSAATPLACLGVIAVAQIRGRGLLRGMTRLWPVLIVPSITAGSILLYWGSQGAVGDLWRAVVLYNLSYVGDVWDPVRLYGAVRTMAADASAGPLMVLAVGAGFALWLSRREWERAYVGDADACGEATTVNWVYVACLIGLGLEMVFLSLAGRGFDHYYMSVLPALCASASYWLPGRHDQLGECAMKARFGRQARPLVLAAGSVWLLVTFGLIRPTADDLRSFVLDAPVRRPLRTNVGMFVKNTTAPDDTVLWWGLGAEVNFEAQRRAPTRYLYFMPLFQPGFADRERWQEFLGELERNRPALIFVPMGGFAPGLDPPFEDLAERCHCGGEVLEGFTAFARYVAENYDRELMWDGAIALYRRKAP